MRIRRKRVYKRRVVKKKENFLKRWLLGNRRNLLIFFSVALVLFLLISGGYLMRNYLKRGVQARFNQALGIYGKGDYEGAMEGFKEVASSFGGGKLDSLSLIYLGNIYYRKANYKEAIETYKGLLASKGDLKILAFYNMAKAYEALGELKEAEKYLNRAYRDPDGRFLKDLISLELASIYERMGEKDKAIDLYRVIEERGPDPLTREFVAEIRAGIR